MSVASEWWSSWVRVIHSTPPAGLVEALGEWVAVSSSKPLELTHVIARWSVRPGEEAASLEFKFKGRRKLYVEVAGQAVSMAPSSDAKVEVPGASQVRLSYRGTLTVKVIRHDPPFTSRGIEDAARLVPCLAAVFSARKPKRGKAKHRVTRATFGWDAARGPISDAELEHVTQPEKFLEGIGYRLTLPDLTPFDIEDWHIGNYLGDLKGGRGGDHWLPKGVAWRLGDKQVAEFKNDVVAFNWG